MQMYNLLTHAVHQRELCQYISYQFLSIALEREIFTFTFKKRLRLFAVHTRWNASAARIIVANRREQIFLAAVPSRDYGRAAYDHVERTH